MDERAALKTRALAGRLVAIIRLDAQVDLLRVAEALLASGITTLEFTLTTPGALEAVAKARETFAEAVVGAGTVLDADAARQCIEAGAQFLVSPGFDPTVIAIARHAGALAMPGALTPTEILAAWQAGADIVKVFPARQFGPRYIADLRGPLPHIPLMPTGGVDETNAAAFLQAGAVSVAVGGKLVDATAVAHEDWAALTRRASLLVQAVQSAGAR